MKSFRMFLLIFISSTIIDQVFSNGCNCLTDAALKKSEDHLKLVTKIQSMKIIPTVEEIIGHIPTERAYLLNRMQYDIIRDLQSTFGKLISHTDFTEHFNSFVEELRNTMEDESISSMQGLHTTLLHSINRFYTRILPSAFLCLSMADCISAPKEYVDCMNTNSVRWLSHFGREPGRIARRLAESFHRYKMLDILLVDIHKMLTSSDKSFDFNCIANYTSITGCEQCIGGETKYCRHSCEQISSKCYYRLSHEWDAALTSLHRMVQDFDDGFNVLERGIQSTFSRLVETTSPLLARSVVDKCGSLEGTVLATRGAPIENKKPKTVAKKTVRLVNQLHAYHGIWRRVSQKICSQPSEDNYCWNGTNIIRGEEWNHQDLPAIHKDVRPRPKDPQIEGSGAPVDWSDDEDIGMEGSAAEFDAIDHESGKADTATVKEEATTIPAPSRLHKPTEEEDTALSREIVDHVIEGATAGDTPDTCSTILLYPLLILALTRYVFH